jgi:hypothetical protein
MAVNGEQHEYFCTACGDAIAEADFEAGKAIRREEKAYCRKCFRKAFPEECEAHPGVKATVRCSVCRRMCCENCVIEIAGKHVCSRCKGWALNKLADGEDLTPDSSLFPDFDEVREKRLQDTFKKAREVGVGSGKSQFVRDRILFRPWAPLVMFYVGVMAAGMLAGSIYLSDVTGDCSATVIIAAVILLVLLVVVLSPIIFDAGSLRTVQVDDWGVSGITFRRKKKRIAWKDVTRVTIRRPDPSLNLSGVVKIYTGKKRLKMGSAFPRFMFIADVVRDICKEKNIKYKERAV